MWICRSQANDSVKDCFCKANDYNTITYTVYVVDKMWSGY